MLTASFRRYCQLLQKISDTRGTKAKSTLFSEWLAGCENETEVLYSVRWAAEGAFSKKSGQKASVGASLTGLVASEVTGIAYETVFKTSKNALGSTTETIEKLLENLLWFQKTLPEERSLADAQAKFDELSRLRTNVQKSAFLRRLYAEWSPVEVKYFLRIAGQHSLRIGFEARSVLQAVSMAFNTPFEEVFDAWMLNGDTGETARLTRAGTLSLVRFSLFHPVPFMLASPYSEKESPLLSRLLAEEKLDGMRAQVHCEGNRVAIFSRDLNDVTSHFPDLADWFRFKNLPETILDGEILAPDENGRFSFNRLQQRLGVKAPSLEIQQKFPLHFVAYDALFANGQVLMKRPLQHRRLVLEKICADVEIALSVQFPVHSAEELRTLFLRAKKNRNEGLMLKDPESVYEAGQRKKAWLKVKEPSGSLTTVLLYAHAGSGKRGGLYSDFTLGVRQAADSEAFVPIGKAYGGYTDAELKQLNTTLKPLILERFGPTLMLKPAIIVELEFDEIQKNTRTKAGFTLRFPRFKTIRWDLGPADADCLEEVQRRFESRV